MQPPNETQEKVRQARAVETLVPQGFQHVGGWLFMKNQICYDLSAANLDMIDMIVSQGLYVVS